MTDTVRCRRCARDAPRLNASPYPGETGELIAQTVCAGCWAEWLKAEVMVINELRLNFMDPRAQQVLTRHMREFLLIDPPTASG